VNNFYCPGKPVLTGHPGLAKAIFQKTGIPFMLKNLSGCRMKQNLRGIS